MVSPGRVVPVVPVAAFALLPVVGSVPDLVSVDAGLVAADAVPDDATPGMGSTSNDITTAMAATILAPTQRRLADISVRFDRSQRGVNPVIGRSTQASPS
jgi:hypothetical protein